MSPSMNFLVIILSIFFLITFTYILYLTIHERSKIKLIEKNSNGMTQQGMEITIERQKKKTRDLLLGFTTGEALKYLTDSIIAVAAIITLFLSSR